MRYDRQIALIGMENQGLLIKKTVAIVGLGAIGSHVSELLARTGVNLIIVDFDKVELSNLQRQSLFDENDVGKYKTEVSLEKLKKINSEINIKVINEKLTENNLNSLYSDIVLDCTDNLEARFLVNKFCFVNKIPWVHAAAIKFSGVVFNFIPNGACFNCIYKNVGEIERCEDIGILNSVASLVSSIQVSEAFKILLNKDYERDFMRVNLESNIFEKIRVRKNKNCNVCQEKVEEIKKFNVKLCKSRGAYSVKLNKMANIDFKTLKDFEAIIETPVLMVLKVDGEEIIVHKYGEIIFKSLKDEQKIIEIANKIFRRA